MRLLSRCSASRPHVRARGPVRGKNRIAAPSSTGVAPVRRVARGAASERGFAIIEVLVSSIILALIVIGTFTAFDSSNRFTANEQDRSQASSIAQQDQDRLRGLQVSQLSNLNATRTVVLNGTTFTVTSTGQFESDASGTSSCGGSGTADYIKTTSTVTWPAMGATPPVVAESIITPPAGGSLIVQVVDASGDPVSGMTVSGSGAGTLNGTTGPDGCVIFGGLNGGSYNVSVSESGYVDKDGNATPPVSQQAITVIPGSSATKTFYFDQAGAIQAYFSSKQYGGATNTNVTGDTLVAFNNNMTYPGYRYFGTAGTPDTPPLVAPNIFPFPSTYTVYAGSCAADAPSAFGATDPTILVPPGQTVTFGGASAINLPALNLVVHSGTGTTSPGSLLSGSHVIITDTGCTPNVKRTFSTDSSGHISNPSLPYGTYTVCADALISSTRRYMSVTGVANSNLSGTTVNLYLQSTTSGTGTCT